MQQQFVHTLIVITLIILREKLIKLIKILITISPVVMVSYKIYHTDDQTIYILHFTKEPCNSICIRKVRDVSEQSFCKILQTVIKPSGQNNM